MGCLYRSYHRSQNFTLRSARTEILPSGGSRLGPGGTGPPNLAQAPQIFRVITVHKLLNTGQLDTVVLLVVASQMMRGHPLPIFFS